MECVELMNTLSQKERNKILSVLKRDERLQNSQERKIRDLKHDIQVLRSKSILRAGDDQNKICLRCRQPFGLLFNRGALCSACCVKVCKDCQEFLFNGSWLCTMCFKQRQLKWLTGEWAIGHDENPLRKWASGSDLVRASMQLRPICTGSIDIDEPPPDREGTRTRKPAQNGVHSSEQGAKSRVDCPKEGDQHRLSQLFDVLRTRKPDDGAAQRVSQTEIKRVSSRKYSDSDSESSTSSNGDEVSVRSSPNTALSMTESELDSRRLESPQYSDTQSPRSVGSPLGSESPKRLISPDKSDESPEKDRRFQKARAAARSPNVGSNRGNNYEPQKSPVQMRDEPVDPERVVRPKARPRAGEKGQKPKGQRPPNQNGEKVKLSAEARDTDKDLLQVDSSLQMHVSRTRESLDKKQEALLSRSRNSMESPVTSGSTSPIGSIPSLSEKESPRKNVDNLSVRSGQSDYGKAQHKKSSENVSVDRMSRTSGQGRDAGVEIRTPTEGVMQQTQGKDISVAHNQDIPVESGTHNADDTQQAANTHTPSDKKQSKHATQTVPDDSSHSFLPVPRGGSPYSISMDSLPSSHPSPTTARSIGGDSSLMESSDTDSVSQYSHKEHSGTESAAPREGSEEDFVVEEISKIRFKTFSKKVAQASVLAKITQSPTRHVAVDEVKWREAREGRTRGGEEGGANVTSSFVNITMSPFEQEEHIKNKQAGELSYNITEDVIEPTHQKANMSYLKPVLGGTQFHKENSGLGGTKDLSWFNEFENSKHGGVQVDNKPLKKSFRALPTHLTSSVSSEKDRIASTDSIEAMIDDMAKDVIYSDNKKPVSASVTPDPFTPVSPIKSLPEVHGLRADNYRFTYDMSDDNLEITEVDNVQNTSVFIKQDQVREEMQTKKFRKFVTNSSLDSLVDDNFGDSDIETEFQDALEIANLKSCDVSDDDTGTDLKTCLPGGNRKEQEIRDNAASLRCQIDTLTHKALEEKVCEVSKSTDSNRNELSSISESASKDKTKSFSVNSSEKKSSSSKRPTLSKENSLDILLHEQGDNIDASMEVIELDEELMAALDADIRAAKSVKKSDISTVSYMGVQIHGATEKPLLYQYKMDPDIAITDAEFDEVFGKASQQNDTKNSNNEKKKAESKQVPFGYAALKEVSDSSDSDMLSPIEEEDEYEEDLKTVQKDSLMQNLNLENIDKETCDQFKAQSRELERVGGGPLKGKIYQKVQFIEKKTTKTQPQTVSSKTKVDSKTQEKYKKLKERWQAIESHEADLLDFEDEQQMVSKEIDARDSEFDLKENENFGAIKTDTSKSLCDVVEEKEFAKPQVQEKMISVCSEPVYNVDNMSEDINEEIIEKVQKADIVSMETVLTKLELTEKNKVTKHEQDTDVLDIVEKSEEQMPVTFDDVNDDQIYSDVQNEHYSIQINPESLSQKDTEEHTYFSSNISGLEITEDGKKDIEHSNNHSIRTKLLMEEQLNIGDKYNLNDNEDHGDHGIDKITVEDTYNNLAEDFENEFHIQQGSKEDISLVIDRNPLCQSIADIETEYSPGNLPKIIVDGYAVTMREDSGKHDKSCLDHTPSIHANLRECKSIEIGEADIFYKVDDDEDVCHSIDEDLDTPEVLENNSVKDKTVKKMFPAQMSLEVIPGDDKSAEPQLMPLTRLSKLKGAPPRPTELPESCPLFAKDDRYDSTEDLPRSASPLTISNPFKPPEAPARTKRTSSSVSSSSSTYSSELMDSPRSGKMLANRDSPQTVSESSMSQDDSGHVSGGSCGNTPEHRRTGSSYSQSSLPSTLSTVTDQSEEEEDIDKVVALQTSKYNSGSRGNLLSVIADSRESIASFYSDAGDIGHSNIPVTGEILFGLNYNYKTGMLEVAVKQCRDIAVADSRRHRTDPYVKCYLLPDKTRGGKRKTKVKKHTVNPTFEETLKYSISKSELENRTLWVTVWHNDRFGRNDFLGEVTINFDYYKFLDPTPNWYSLQERTDSAPTSMMVYKGDISLRIRYVPADKLETSPSRKGKQKKEGNKGQLQVLVKEARNLTAVRANGSSDPFCKAYLLPERHKSSKQKTFVVKKNCNPVWNHTFVFENVTPIELRERCLELTIWDFEKLSSNDFLGGVRLNLGTGLSASKPVEWMDARGEEMSMWQAMLDRPNFWIDGALILRPNMDKRKY